MTAPTPDLRRPSVLRVLPAAALLTALPALAGSPVTFTERALQAGCNHIHQTASLFSDLEFQNAGGAAGDFDRDGDQDLFVIGGSAGTDRLYLNDGTGNFTDVSAAAGIDQSHRGSGVAVADIDADGDLDIMVTSVGSSAAQGPGTNKLYRNNGDGTFTDVAFNMGVKFTNPSVGDAYSASFGDYDLDGRLDLAVAGYFGGNRLYRNLGPVFLNVTPAALPQDMASVRGFTPRFVDMDGDRYPDLLWAGDFFTSRYLVNNGAGVFIDQTAASGTSLDSNGMGSTVADFDNDGDLDWYVTSRINFDMTAGSGNMLYLQGPTPHVYAENSVAAGVNYGLWGWGTDAQDFDHDGHVDLVATNGFDNNFTQDPTRFYLNNADGTFTEAAADAGITDTGQGRGLLTADFDNDGDRDIIIFNNRQPMLLYRNDLPNPGAHAITVFLDTRGVPGVAPDGIGSMVTATTDDGSQIRHVHANSNYLAQSEMSAHFGLGGATAADITIAYPDGHTVTYPDVPAGRYTIARYACFADLNRDGNSNIFDILDFISLYNTRHPNADANLDGQYNIFDILEYINAYNAGCP